MSEKSIWSMSVDEIAERQRYPQQRSGDLEFGDWIDKRAAKKEERALARRQQGIVDPFEAWTRFGVSYIALNLLNRGQRLDALQNGILKAADSTVGYGQSVLPTPQVIDTRSGIVERKFASILPKGSVTPSRIDERIDKDARNLAYRVESGALDNEYDTTSDERLLAQQLTLRLGNMPPDDLRAILRSGVFARTADIASAAVARSFVNDQRTLSGRLKRLEEAVDHDEAWIVADWVTTAGMSGSEQLRMKDTVWAITPTGIKVKSLGKGEDIPDIPWSLIGTLRDGESGNFRIQQKYLDWAEYLRGKGGRFFRPLIEHFRQDLGGVLNITTYGRPEAVAQFAVRNPDLAEKSLNRTASLVKGYYDLLGKMTDALQKADDPYLAPIRPSHVLKQLPKYALEYPLGADQAGNLDWTPALDTIATTKRRLSGILEKRALETASRLDKSGRLRSLRDQEALDAIMAAIQENSKREQEIIEMQQKGRRI